MPFLASDVMDDAAALLNDVPKSNYTYTVQLPFCRRANEMLEKIFISYGISVQLTKSTAITVAINALTLTLPSDFLLPINLWERNSGATNDAWVPMSMKTWEPESAVPTTSLTYWAFRNNAINFIGATTARDVLLEYQRQLAVISGTNSPEDTSLAKVWLGAKTAELCARYVGMNKTFADEIRDNEVGPAEDNLIRGYILQQQGNKVRRPRYSAQRQSSV